MASVSVINYYIVVKLVIWMAAPPSVLRAKDVASVIL